MEGIARGGTNVSRGRSVISQVGKFVSRLWRALNSLTAWLIIRRLVDSFIHLTYCYFIMTLQVLHIEILERTVLD